MGSRRGEHVTAGERRSGSFQLVRRVVELDRPCGSTGEGDGRGEETVVRADEDPGAVADFDGDRLAARAHPGIDDGEDDALGDVGDRPGQRQ